MANNELRKDLQSEAVRTLVEKHRLLVEWATGVGKSRVAVEAVKSIVALGKEDILLLVTETEHKNNWRREFIDALGEEGGKLFDMLTVECYASLPKYAGSKWDFIIADEAHHMRSEARTALVSGFTTEYFLCLSATMSDRGDADVLIATIENRFGRFERMKFGLQKAIDNEILSRPTVIVHILDLDSISDEKEIVISWGRKTYMENYTTNKEGFFDMLKHESEYRDASITVKGTAEELYCVLKTYYTWCKKRYENLEDISRDVNASDRERYHALLQKEFAKNRMLRASLDRKHFLGSIKTDCAKDILKEISDKKFVCFCSSVEQGQLLNAENLIYAERKGNDKVIEAFNRGDIRSLFAVGMIQEGANLSGIEAGLIVQLDSKERPFIQKFGRTLRSDTPLQHIIVCNKTRDADYLKEALADINPKYIKYVHGAAS